MTQEPLMVEEYCILSEYVGLIIVNPEDKFVIFNILSGVGCTK